MVEELNADAGVDDTPKPTLMLTDLGPGFRDGNYHSVIAAKGLTRFPPPEVKQAGGSPDLLEHENAIKSINHHLKNNPRFMFRIVQTEEEEQELKPWHESGQNFMIRLEQVVQFMNTNPEEQQKLKNIFTSFNKRMNDCINKKGGHIGR